MGHPLNKNTEHLYAQTHSLTHSLIHSCNIEDALRLSNQQSPPQLTSETMASNKQQEEAAAEMRLLLEGTPEKKIRAWLEPTINKHDGCFRSGNWMADLVPYVTVHSLSPETNTLTLQQ